MQFARRKPRRRISTASVVSQRKRCGENQTVGGRVHEEEIEPTCWRCMHYETYLRGVKVNNCSLTGEINPELCSEFEGDAGADWGVGDE